MPRFARLLNFALAIGFVATANADTATFSLHKAMDPSTHHVALTYLIPKGWKAADTVNWDLQRRSAPMEFSLASASSDGRFAVAYLSTIVFQYNRSPNGVNGKVPPEQPTDMIVDSFKSSHPGVDVEIIDREEKPAKSIFKETNVSKSRALNCSVKLRYMDKGVPMIWKSGFDVDGYDMGTEWGRSHGFTTGFWSISNVASITGPEAEFPKAMKCAAVVLSSRRWDPQFFQQVQEVCQMILKQMQNENQQRINARFASIRKEYHPMSGTSKAAFEAQMAAKDKHCRNFCDYVLDRQRYTDGSTEFIMPSGYNRAATNGSDYVLTNSSSYSAGGDWHELRKVD